MFDGGGHGNIPSTLVADRVHASASHFIADAILAIFLAAYGVCAMLLLVGALAGLVSYAFDISIVICVPPSCGR